MAIGGALSVGLIGLKAFIIQLQAFISPGLPYFSIIGLPDASLSEARERVKSGCTAAGVAWPQTRVTVNMSPASLPKRGSSHDLAIAASVLSAQGIIDPECLTDTVVLGELNLDGTVLPINGLLPILLWCPAPTATKPSLWMVWMWLMSRMWANCWRCTAHRPRSPRHAPRCRPTAQTRRSPLWSMWATCATSSIRMAQRGHCRPRRPAATMC